MRKNWNKFIKIWMKFSHLLGNFMSTLIMIIFYYSFFALFAIPYKILSTYNKEKKTSWVKTKDKFNKISYFQSE